MLGDYAVQESTSQGPEPEMTREKKSKWLRIDHLKGTQACHLGNWKRMKQCDFICHMDKRWIKQKNFKMPIPCRIQATEKQLESEFPRGNVTSAALCDVIWLWLLKRNTRVFLHSVMPFLGVCLEQETSLSTRASDYLMWFIKTWSVLIQLVGWGLIWLTVSPYKKWP